MKIPIAAFFRIVGIITVLNSYLSYGMGGLDLYYQFSLQPQQLATLGIPNDVINILNQFNITSRPTLSVASNAITKSDGSKLLPGFTLQSAVNVESFLQQVAAFVPVPKQLLTSTTLQLNIPFTYSKPQDMTVTIGAGTHDTQEEPLAMSGLLEIIGLQKMKLGDELIEQLDTINIVPTSYEITVAQGTLRYELKAAVTLFGFDNVEMHLRLEPAEQKNEHPRTAVTFTIPSSDFGLGQISKDLAPFDETVTFNTPTMTFANYNNTQEGTIDGLIIQSGANFGEPFKAIMAPDGSHDQVTVQVKIPRKIEKASDVSVNVTSSGLRSDKVCLNDLMSKLGASFTVGPLQPVADSLCLYNVFANVRLVGEDSALELHGDTKLFGKQEQSVLYLQKRQLGVGVTLVTDANDSNSIRLADIDSKLSPFDQFGTISNYRIAFANWNNPDDLLAFSEHMQQGFSMTGIMQFNGYVGKILSLFGLEKEKFLVQIPVGKDLLDGFLLAIKKAIDKTIGGKFLQLNNLILGLKFTGTPPEPAAELSLEGVSTLPGCDPHGIILEGTLAPTEFELAGGLTEKEDVAASDKEDNTVSARIQLIGTPIFIDKPVASISFAAGEIVGFGGGGTITLNNKELTLYTQVDVEQPKKMALLFNAHNVSLTDSVNMGLALFGNAKLNVTLPPIFTFKDFTLHYAPDVVKLPNDVIIRQGWGANGKLTFLTTTFDIDATYSLSGATYKGVGDKPLQLAPGIVLSDNTGTKGPAIDIELNFTAQRVTLTGNLVIGTNKLINNGAVATIDADGIHVASNATILDVTADVAATLPIQHPADGSITITWQQGITQLAHALVTQGVQATVGQAQNFLNKANNIFTSINGICNKLPSSTPGCSQATSIIDNATNLMRTISNKATALTNFQIQQLQVKTTINALLHADPVTAIATVVIAGQPTTITVSALSLTNPTAAAQAIAQAILTATNELEPLIKQLENIPQQLEQIFTDLGNMAATFGKQLGAALATGAKKTGQAVQAGAAAAKQAALQHAAEEKAALQAAATQARRAAFTAARAASRAASETAATTAQAAIQATQQAAAAAQAAYQTAQAAYQAAEQAYQQAAGEAAGLAKTLGI
ncbi:hypothetical protein M1466_03855 [Candidatus Dependentiae bacterium]|nr:hypothetical protein [Candidatus Dependentiae bacterium]